MIVYTDINSGDQVLSDSYTQKPLVYDGEEVEGIVTVQSRLVAKGGETFDTGANASAEEQEEGGDDTVQKVIDVADPETGFGYEGPMTLNKAEFGALYKKWCKETKEKIVENGQKPKQFMESAKAFLGVLNKEFKNFEIYQTKSFDSFVVGWWDDEANTSGSPKFIYFSHALLSEKY